MDRLTNEELKVWLQFYLRLIGTCIVNGFFSWLKVFSAGIAAQGAGLIDIRTLGWKGAGWTLFSTLLVTISISLFRNPLPEPTPPPTRKDTP